ncbi:hypothetical protein FDP41_005109 [Naegleria fowleri]|uniref:Proteasome assembly chaperone 3 n=1 Tax=Naegleria fowleri TaxID=5763 RepID=A0A6A5BLQ2_NAEFO|nr:uncharacterized protein FDP41_005109 [Naegleria fowleri]KAF0975782.1 hypothetical protein FDP41_005109 [Naegleria fowleri]CAG4707830.1 unnamed protein product [Naegleria fowleri]
MINTCSSSSSNQLGSNAPFPPSQHQFHEITDQQGYNAFPIHVANRAFNIEETYHTEVVRIVFADKIVFIISQLDALAGTIIKAEKDNSNALTMTVSQNYDDDYDDDFSQLPEPTYSVRTLFGKRAPSLESDESFLDVETIFARLLIEELYKPKQQRSNMQIPDLMEPPMPMTVLEKPLIICLTFSKEFQNRLKQPKIGKLAMKQLIDCVVNKI